MDSCADWPVNGAIRCPIGMHRIVACPPKSHFLLFRNLVGGYHTHRLYSFLFKFVIGICPVFLPNKKRDYENIWLIITIINTSIINLIVFEVGRVTCMSASLRAQLEISTTVWKLDQANRFEQELVIHPIRFLKLT